MRTYQRLTAAYTTAFPLGEETITDNALLDLKIADLPSLWVAKTGKLMEAKQGTDWDLWLRVADGPWLRYAIQAKKLGKAVPRGRYDKLRHRVGGQWQIEVLAWYAQHTGAIPLYCLYNGGAGLDRASPYSDAIEQFGCTVAPLWLAYEIHQSGRSKSYHEFHKSGHAFPWRYLLLAHQDWAAGSDASVGTPLGSTPIVRPWLRSTEADAMPPARRGSRRHTDFSDPPLRELPEFRPSLNATPPPENFLRDLLRRGHQYGVPDGWRQWFPEIEGRPVLPRRLTVIDVNSWNV